MNFEKFHNQRQLIICLHCKSLLCHGLTQLSLVHMQSLHMVARAQTSAHAEVISLTLIPLIVIDIVEY